MKNRSRVIVLTRMPALLVITLVALVTIVFQFYTSLHELRLGCAWDLRKLLGFDTYTRLFARAAFRHAFWITVHLAFTVTLGSLILSLVFAMLSNRPFRFKSIVVSSVLIPVTISPRGSSD